MRMLMLMVPALALAAPVPEIDAEKAARGFIEKAKAAHGELTLLKNDSLAKILPDVTLFTLRFRQWPVAIAPAEGFQSSNLIVINDRAEPKLLADRMDLGKLFAKVSARDDRTAQTVVQALLALEAEMLQDGFYKFRPVEGSLETVKEGDRRIARGKLAVVEGGSGEITVSVTFDGTGLVFGSSLNNTVKIGQRPRRLGD